MANVWTFLSVALIAIGLVPFASHFAAQRLDRETRLCFPRNKIIAEYDEFAGFTQVYHVDGYLARQRSFYQRVEVAKSDFFGNILLIDGAVMTTELDQHNYHEMIVHVPMAYRFKQPSINALVIGAGDGGTPLELLRYDNVNVTMVEIDKKVVRLAREHLSTGSVFDDSRLNLIYDDGAKFVNRSLPNLYDVVLVDSTDFNMAESLLTSQFYFDVKRVLKPDGVFVFNVDSPLWSLLTVQRAYLMMNAIFGRGKAHPFNVAIPTYTSGTYSFMLVNQAPNASIDWDAWEMLGFADEMKYYTPQIHRAAFIYPKTMSRYIQQPPLAI